MRKNFQWVHARSTFIFSQSLVARQLVFSSMKNQRCRFLTKIPDLLTENSLLCTGQSSFFLAEWTDFFKCFNRTLGIVRKVQVLSGFFSHFSQLWNQVSSKNGKHFVFGFAWVWKTQLFNYKRHLSRDENFVIFRLKFNKLEKIRTTAGFDKSFPLFNVKYFLKMGKMLACYFISFHGTNF